MDPSTMMMLGSLAGKGGGGSTKISTTTSNSASAIISANISGVTANPATGSVSAPVNTNATGGATGADIPSYSDAALGNDSMGMGAGESVAPVATGFTANQNTLYILGAVVMAAVAYFIFWKK